MSEISKLYENAGVDYEERYNNCTLNKEGECKLKCSCDICKYSEERYIYPPFTAEKQLGLIKWLAFKDYISIIVHPSGEYYSECDSYHAVKNSLEECLATLVNNLWQDLIEEEKQQIKEILE